MENKATECFDLYLWITWAVCLETDIDEQGAFWVNSSGPCVLYVDEGG